MKKQILVAVTALTMICATPMFTAYAEPNPEEVVTETVVEEYAYTQSLGSTLSINGSNATCSSDVNGNSSCTKIVATQKLQKKTLWWWTDVATWTKTVNGATLSMVNVGSASSSGTYRCRIEATVYSGSNSENVYANSVEKTK